MTQEECWEFFADNMAPFTSPQSVSLSSSCFSGTAMQEDQAKEVISSFFGALAICLGDADTYKVKTTPINFKEALKIHISHILKILYQCCINTIAIESISVVF